MKIPFKASIITTVAAMMCAVFVSPLVPSPAYAACPGTTQAEQLRCGASSAGTDKTPIETYIKRVVNLLTFIIGAVSVVVIVLGAFKYVTSNGDTAAITSAKNTILYAVIGLIVAISAYALAGFVTDAITGAVK